MWLVKTIDGITRFLEVDLRAKPREPKAPAVHIDSMEPLKHPLTGQYFDSKNKYREVTKEHGYMEAGGIIDPSVPDSELEINEPEILAKIEEHAEKWITPSAREEMLQRHQREMEAQPEQASSPQEDFSTIRHQTLNS
jgi:hypothetical protein